MRRLPTRLVGSGRGATRIEINLASSSFHDDDCRTGRRTGCGGPANLFRGARLETRLVSSRTKYFLGRPSRVVCVGCKPRPPLEIAGIRAAVPLAFELHEYSRRNDHREEACTRSLVHTRFRAFFAVFPRQLRPGTKLGISKVRSIRRDG